MPSLRQLVEAVQAFMAEHPTALLTVVVDATFGHRIDPREVPEFDAAIDHNELVAPPAGAVGRGDAFVLAIADKVDATILSNDSYQEFHGEYPWLFDEGRLIGGKPVPNVGWVFVPRVPVRGPLSRRSQRDAKERGRSEPSPAAPIEGREHAAAGAVGATAGRGGGGEGPRSGTRSSCARAVGAHSASGGSNTGDKRTSTGVPAPAAKTDVPTPARSTMINDLLPFLGFVEHHPVGSIVQAVVESYSSHGAYVTIGDVRAYIPLRFMADPPPRSAREAMKLHDEVSLVVVGFHAQRRGIDLAAPELAASITGMNADEVAASATPTKRTRKSTKATAATPAVTAPAAGAADGEPPEKPVKAATARKRAAKTPIDEGGTPAGDAPAAAARWYRRRRRTGRPRVDPRRRRHRIVGERTVGHRRSATEHAPPSQRLRRRRLVAGPPRRPPLPIPRRPRLRLRLRLRPRRRIRLRLRRRSGLARRRPSGPRARRNVRRPDRARSPRMPRTQRQRRPPFRRPSRPPGRARRRRRHRPDRGDPDARRIRSAVCASPRGTSTH